MLPSLWTQHAPVSLYSHYWHTSGFTGIYTSVDIVIGQLWGKNLSQPLHMRLPFPSYPTMAFIERFVTYLCPALYSTPLCSTDNRGGGRPSTRISSINQHSCCPHSYSRSEDLTWSNCTAGKLQLKDTRWKWKGNSALLFFVLLTTLTTTTEL